MNKIKILFESRFLKQGVIVVMFCNLFFTTLSAKNIDVIIQSQVFHLEVVSTMKEKERGLSYRTALANDCGMLFFYEDDEVREFYMYQCLIPLDLIYLNKEGTVMDIFEMQVEPLSTPQPMLKRYRSTNSVRHALELNAGTSKKLGLKKGDRVHLIPTKI